MIKLIVALMCTAVIFCSVNTHIYATVPSGPDIPKQAADVEKEKGNNK